MMRLEMPYDARKPPATAKPAATPKAPARNKAGAYVTPRLAASPVTNVSPNIKKEPIATTNATTRATAGEDISTPVKNFLSSNITPRSGSRKARVDSASSTPRSTPNGTPTSSRPASIVASKDQDKDGVLRVHGLGLNTDACSARAYPDKSTLSMDSPTLARKGTSPERISQIPHEGADSPKFFYANDATIGPRRTSQGSLASKAGFFYADGKHEPPAKSIASSQSGVQPKFYHANGAPESAGESPRSPVLTMSATAQAYTTQIRSPILPNSRHRSTSPLKEFEVPMDGTLRRNRRSSGVSNLSLQSAAAKSVVPPAPSRTTPPTERLPVYSHSKAQSVSSFKSQTLASNIAQSTPSMPSVQSTQSLPDTARAPSPLQPVQTQTLPPPITSPVSPLVSPTHQQATAGPSKIDQLNNLAANARRERKVLDLEISNSSLLAINRTLEREMRKQKAELRRYRRLTSSGRLSIAPTERSVSSSTGFSALSDIDSDDEERLDGDDASTEMLSEEDEFDETDNSSLSLSPGAQTTRNARQRARDEKRLRLDLDRHQEILIDSQRMNQSLKRCLGWTEELILEGRKALAYQVRVSDVAMGGRVLHADDESGATDSEPRKALLSPTHVYADDVKNMPWENDGSWELREQVQSNNIGGAIAPDTDNAEEGKDFREYLDGLNNFDTRLAVP